MAEVLIGESPALPRPKPRGLLPVPPVVAEVVDQERDRLARDLRIVPTPEATKRLRDSLTLQYYYEGLDVAYRVTAQGVEVLAVGHEEIGRFVAATDETQRRSIKIGQP